MYSIADLSGSAGQSNFAFSFPYLSQDHIFVYIDEVETTDFTFNSTFVIHLTTALAAAATVRIQRITPLDEALVNYNNGSTLGESDLDTATLQLLYIVQEQQDTNTVNLGECLRRPASDDGVLADMPDEATRANSLLYFDANGDPTVVAHITSGTLSFTPLTQFLSGNGSQTVFALSSPPGSHSALILAISGVVQKPGVDFTVSGSVLTFTTAPAAGANNIAIQNFGVAREVDTVPAGGIVGQILSTQIDTSLTAPAGSVTRLQSEKNYDRWSVRDFGVIGDGVTNDTANIQAAVTACLASGRRELWWPNGTYITTSSIANLHSVIHSGPGRIVRGSNTFYISPNLGDTNNLYVATTGNNANDGLSSSEPTQTIQQAIDWLSPYTPLKGHWVINIAAGTYAEAATIPQHTSFSDDYLEITGPVPPTGTAVGATTNSAGYALNATTVTLASAGTGSFIVGDTVTFAGSTSLHRITSGDADVSGGGSITFTPGLNLALAAAPVAITRVTTNWAIPTVIINCPPGGGLAGLDTGYHNRTKISHIKFTNWLAANNGTTGLNANDDSIMWTDNIHVLLCRQGIVGNGCQLYISGGLIEGNTWSTGSFPSGGGTNGVVLYAGARCSLSYGATNEQTGTMIQHWLGAGLHEKSGCHCVSTHTTFKSNARAVHSYTNGRFDDRTNYFRKNALCYYVEASMITSDQQLGPSEYNFGKSYHQSPDSLNIGTAAGATTDATGYAAGLKAVTLAAAGTGTIVQGDTITFAGDATEYVIVTGDTNVADGGSIAFTPGLVGVIPAAPTAITIVPKFSNGNFAIWKFRHYASCEELTHVGGIGGLDVARARASTLQTGTIASTLTRALCTIPAGALAVNSEFNYYEVHLVGATTGAAGTKTILLRLHGVTIATLIIPTGTVAWSARTEIWNTTSYGQVIANTTAVGATVTQQRLTPLQVNAWADQVLDVFTAIPGAADTATLHESRVIKWG